MGYKHRGAQYKGSVFRYARCKYVISEYINMPICDDMPVIMPLYGIMQICEYAIICKYAIICDYAIICEYANMLVC